MPRYDYRCEGDHIREIVAGYEDVEVPCPECGLPSRRMPYCVGVAIRGDTVSKPTPTREHRINLDRFQDAQLEIQHDCARAGVEPPDCYQIAKDRIKKGDAVAIE